MISIWEAAQGLLFMATFGWITRSALNLAYAVPRPLSGLIPAPRDSREEEHGSLTLG